MTKEIERWADTAMFTAETSDASAGPTAFVLGAPVDPLGQIAACAKMYLGEVVRDLADVTDEERRRYLTEIQKTALKMPLEAVSIHFMLEGVHRGITHQMVRQRTAAYAQESTRFAVKADLKTATALPPSLEGTLSFEDFSRKMTEEYAARGMVDIFLSWDDVYALADDIQKQRINWDRAVSVIGETYMDLINTGMPAEEARGLMPTNITTRLNYITNLRSFYETMAVRVSDQAQFEWRKVAMAYALALREYGAKQSYWTTVTDQEYIVWDQKNPSNPILERRYVEIPPDEKGIASRVVQIRLSSAWQYEALTNEIKPIEFKIGGPAFGANFDRPSRIGERVRAFHSMGIPSSEWTTGSEKHSIPPIHPEEWLLDPNSARLSSGMEFDIFGNRVPVGTGWHWDDGFLVKADSDESDGTHPRRWPLDFASDGSL